MSETTPLIKAALNLRVGVGFDVYLLTIQYPERSWQLLRCPQIYWGSEVGCISRVSSDCLTISMNEYLYYISTHIHGISSLPVSIICFSKNISDLIK